MKQSLVTRWGIAGCIIIPSENPDHGNLLILQIVEWSEEEKCYIGTVPGLISGIIHGDSEIGVYKELIETVEQTIEFCQKEGRTLPPPELPSKKKPARRGTDEPFLRLMEIGGLTILKVLGKDGVMT